MDQQFMLSMPNPPSKTAVYEISWPGHPYHGRLVYYGKRGGGLTQRNGVWHVEMQVFRPDPINPLEGTDATEADATEAGSSETQTPRTEKILLPYSVLKIRPDLQMANKKKV